MFNGWGRARPWVRVSNAGGGLYSEVQYGDMSQSLTSLNFSGRPRVSIDLRQKDNM